MGLRSTGLITAGARKLSTVPRTCFTGEVHIRNFDRWERFRETR
jgi:hypothetical protein